jgi:hypothetical protein
LKISRHLVQQIEAERSFARPALGAQALVLVIRQAQG